MVVWCWCPLFFMNFTLAYLMFNTNLHARTHTHSHTYMATHVLDILAELFEGFSFIKLSVDYLLTWKIVFVRLTCLDILLWRYYNFLLKFVSKSIIYISLPILANSVIAMWIFRWYEILWHFLLTILLQHNNILPWYWLVLKLCSEACSGRNVSQINWLCSQCSDLYWHENRYTGN